MPIYLHIFKVPKHAILENIVGKNETCVHDFGVLSKIEIDVYKSVCFLF